jgi:hypothetical protein
VDALTDQYPSWSPYTYVLNSPLRLVDPTGMASTNAGGGCPPNCDRPLSINQQLYYAFGGAVLDRLLERVRTTADAIQQTGGATKDFINNYNDMREANTIDADKYFHCKANCEASQRGEIGEKTAEVISDVREFADRIVKGDPTKASEADQEANRYGRQEANKGECENVCGTFRPGELNKKY